MIEVPFKPWVRERLVHAVAAKTAEQSTTGRQDDPDYRAMCERRAPGIVEAVEHSLLEASKL